MEVGHLTVEQLGEEVKQISHTPPARQFGAPRRNHSGLFARCARLSTTGGVFREPGYDEVVAENLVLRAQLAALLDEVATLKRLWRFGFRRGITG